jgi:hypothetical protein
MGEGGREERRGIRRRKLYVRREKKGGRSGRGMKIAKTN